MLPQPIQDSETSAAQLERRTPTRARAALFGAATVLDLGATLCSRDSSLSRDKELSEMATRLIEQWESIEEAVREAVILVVDNLDEQPVVEISSPSPLPDRLHEEVSNQLLGRLRSLLEGYRRSAHQATWSRFSTYQHSFRTHEEKDDVGR